MGFPKLLVVAIPIGLWRWSAQVMLPAAFSALWTCREPLELLPLGDLILEWFHGKMTGTEATTGTEPQILKTTWKSSVLHPKHFWPHVWEHIGCNSPFHECTKTKINPHGIAFTSSKIRQFLLSWINQLVFSPCFPMFFPCFPMFCDILRRGQWIYLFAFHPVGSAAGWWKIPRLSPTANPSCRTSHMGVSENSGGP